MASQNTTANGAAPKQGGTLFVRNLTLWAVVAVVWFIFDRATKLFFDGNFQVGDVVVSNIAGLVRFNLVHNVGVAWGMFAGQIPVIVIFTALMCLVIAAFSVYWARSCTKLEMFALAILFSGGIGNLVDRVAYGYVVDFITPLFIKFPTFNVADIGVTCGVVLLAIAWIVQIVREGKTETGSSEHNDSDKE